MRLTRRAFFATAGVCLAPSLAKLYGAEPPRPRPLKLEETKETTTICCYCGVGCGMVVAAKDGKVVNIEGDPDHPINEGALCSKGSSLYQVAVNERRLDKVRYRAKGSDRWEEKEWDWALTEIAKRLKAARDASFVREKDGTLVNRTEGVACLGGAALDNEECYLLSKMMRSLGITYLEHQARI